MTLEPVAQQICRERGLHCGPVVGAGTFKETFHATDPRSGTVVALKIYRPGASTARAQREIDAMLRCDHPNVAKLLDVNVVTVGTEQYVYCLEEFLAGGTLGQVAANQLLGSAEAHR